MLTDQKKGQIELNARTLHREILARGKEVLGNTPSHFHVIEPRIAAKHLGLLYEEVPSLGRFGQGNDRFEVAGVIDPRNRAILISTHFDFEVQRFTAAHELGHWRLHDDISIQHRDRPIKGMGKRSGPLADKEREADYFAACFLMPARLVELVFKQMYGCSIQEFPFNDRTAWLLSPDDPDLILRPQAGARSRALALASFNGAKYQSLARTFNVSITTMAIRLEELGLCAEWP